MDSSRDQASFDFKEPTRYRTEDVGGGRFSELCRQNRAGEIHAFIVECNIPGCRTLSGKPIDGLYRVHYTG